MAHFNAYLSLPIKVNTMVETIKFQIEQRLKPLEGNKLVTKVDLLNPQFKKISILQYQ